MLKSIELDSVAIDWITVTSKAHAELDRAFTSFLMTQDCEEPKRENRLQFKGESWESMTGVGYYGYYFSEKTGEHTMVQVSGEMAHDALLSLLPVIKNGFAKVTRIDIQTTVKQPESWEQIRFFNRLEKNGRKPQWRSSTDKKHNEQMVGIGIGSRQSETYARVYQKITNGGVKLLRFEGEYKGRKAEAIVHDLEQFTPVTMLKWHIQKYRDKQLEQVFANVLNGITPHKAKPRVKEVDKTAEWLLSSALPAFKRVIAQHGGDSGVSAAFLQAMIDGGKMSPLI